MIPGIKIEFKSHFKFDAKEFSHFSKDCSGQVKVGLSQNEPFYLTPKIAFRMPLIIRLNCESCGASMIPDEHKEDIEKIIVALMLTHNQVLPPIILKFVRQYFGKSQAEISNILSISDRQYRKFEDENSGLRMQINELKLLKMWYLDQLGIYSEKDFRLIFQNIFSSNDENEFNFRKIAPPDEFINSIRNYATKNNITVVNA